MKYFNLYKKCRYGWFHVTAFQFETLSQAIEFYRAEFYAVIGNEVGMCKVSGL